MFSTIKFNVTMNFKKDDPRMDYIAYSSVDDDELNKTYPTSTPYYRGIHIL